MSSTFTQPLPPARPSPVTGRVRRLFVGALIGSLCTTGLLGMVAVGAGSFGELEGRVLLTTLLVGVYSVLCLAGLVVVGRRHGWVGQVGIAFTSLALVCGLVLTWGVDEDVWGADNAWLEFVARSFGFCAILGVAFVHAALLLHLTRRGSEAARAIGGATLVAVGVVAAMLAQLVALSDSGGGEGFWRVLGVFAILDVVGTVITPLVARLDRPTPVTGA